MANSEAKYVKIGLEDDDSLMTIRITKSGVKKVGIALISVTGIALLSIMALSTFSSAAEPTSVPESASPEYLAATGQFSGVPSSFRSAQKPGPMVPSLASLPGPSHLKNLALKAIEASNRCDRDVSVNALWRNMDSASRDVVVKAAQGGIKKMSDLQAGQTGPMGFFDPAGLSADLDAGKILFYREAELKHGRVCMLASLGFLVGENFHPLFGGNIDVPSYIAFQETPLQFFWPIVLGVIAIPEFRYSVPTFQKPLNTTTGLFNIEDLDRIPGDIGFDPLNLKPKDPEELLNMQNKELNNGRLAMIATAGMVAQDLVSGDKLLETAGKLR